MPNDIEYQGWIIRDNPHMADGNAQKFAVLPPQGSRCHRMAYGTLEEARQSVDRRCGKVADGGDDLLQEVVMTRRKVTQLRTQLDSAIRDALAAKKAFMERDSLLRQ